MEAHIVREASQRIAGEFFVKGHKQASSPLEEALLARVFNNLRPISFGLAILFQVLAVSHLFVLSGPESWILALVASGTCGVLIFFRIALEYFNLPRNLSHTYSFMIAALVLTNSLLHLYLVPEPRHTTNLLLLVVGMGFLFLSTEYFVLGVSLSWLGWGYALLRAGLSTLWIHYGFALFTATVLSSIVHAAHVRSVRKLETFKLDLEEKVRERTKELQSQLEELQVLHDISVKATDTFDEDVVIRRTINRLSETLFPERLSVMLLDKEEKKLVLHESCRDAVQNEKVFSIPVGKGVTGRVALTGEPQLVPDVREVPYYIEDNPRMRSELCVPIKAGKEVLGVVNVDSPEVDGFTDSDLRFLTTMAGQLASAIDRIRWFDETKETLNRLNALHRIDQVISNSTELIPILNVFLKEIFIQLKMDAVSVLLYNQQNGTLDYIAGEGFQTVNNPPLRSGIEQGYLGETFQTQEILMAPDLDPNQFSNHHREVVEAEGFQSYVAVPLITKEEIKGVLEIYFREATKPKGDWIESLQVFADQVAMAIENINVLSDLQQANIDLHLTYNKTLEGWAKALELRDAETEGHSRRVSELTGVLGRKLGLDDRELVHLYWGSLLHDLGKLGIPDHILHKEEPLTTEERELVERHPDYGRKLLEEIDYLKPAIDILYHHHEKWDGSGYPQGLAKEQIPLKARIFAVVDVYDALSSDRPYRDAWPEEKVIQYIRDQAGKHFDPEIVDQFLSIVDGKTP